MRSFTPFETAGRARVTWLTVILLASVAWLAGAAALQAQDLAVPEAEEGESIFMLLVKGGPVMIPLGLCSLIALTMSFERFISLGRGKVLPVASMAELEEASRTRDGIHNKGKALAYVRQREGEFFRVLERSLLQLDRGREAAESSYADAAIRLVSRMRRSLRALRVIGTVAPLLGLLGTVVGMIRAFQTVATTSGSLGRPEMLAKGIYEAMVTTAAGLAIAIPTLVVYFYLLNRVESISDELEVRGEEFLSHFFDAETDAKKA